MADWVPKEGSGDDSSAPVLKTIGLAKVFTYEQLEQATNSFHSSRAIGDGGYGSVYLGNLDGREVAVKTLSYDHSRRHEQFLNEVMLLSRLRHPYLINLYGCTSPFGRNELLLVYDYMPNGTVADHLHGKQVAEGGGLTWDTRMRIAVETAEAIAYLHGLQPPVIHHDVKTSNILLDANFTVKVADVGLCRQVPWDVSHVANVPESTFCYRDPEYNRTGILTRRSDVYSFGFVLLELISGMMALDPSRDEDEVYLLDMALNLDLQILVDPTIGYDGNPEIRRMVTSVAKLAWRCLESEGKMRPPMVEVIRELKLIKDSAQAIDVDGNRIDDFDDNTTDDQVEDDVDSCSTDDDGMSPCG